VTGLCGYALTPRCPDCAFWSSRQLIFGTYGLDDLNELATQSLDLVQVHTRVAESDVSRSTESGSRDGAELAERYGFVLVRHLSYSRVGAAPAAVSDPAGVSAGLEILCPAGADCPYEQHRMIAEEEEGAQESVVA